MKLSILIVITLVLFSLMVVAEEGSSSNTSTDTSVDVVTDAGTGTTVEAGTTATVQTNTEANPTVMPGKMTAAEREHLLQGIMHREGPTVKTLINNLRTDSNRKSFLSAIADRIKYLKTLEADPAVSKDLSEKRIHVLEALETKTAHSGSDKTSANALVNEYNQAHGLAIADFAIARYEKIEGYLDKVLEKSQAIIDRLTKIQTELHTKGQTTPRFDEAITALTAIRDQFSTQAAEFKTEVASVKTSLAGKTELTSADKDAIKELNTRVSDLKALGQKARAIVGKITSAVKEKKKGLDSLNVSAAGEASAGTETSASDTGTEGSSTTTGEGSTTTGGNEQ